MLRIKLMSSPGIIHNVIIPTVAPESCPPIPVLTYAVRQILCLASFMSFREEIFSLLCTIDATTSHLKRNVERLLHVGDSRLSNDTSQDPSERSRETTARAILRVIERAQEVLVAVLCNISQYVSNPFISLVEFTHRVSSRIFTLYCHRRKPRLTPTPNPLLYKKSGNASIYTLAP